MKQAAILLVEDELSDATLMMRGFKKAGVENPIRHVKSGTEALAYLHGLQPYADREQNPAPVVILLDLKLPDMSGLSLLETLKHSPDARQIPVVVLTAERDQRVIDAAYSAGASSYLVKTFAPEEVARLAEEIAAYWVNRDPERRIVLRAKGGL